MSSIQVVKSSSFTCLGNCLRSHCVKQSHVFTFYCARYVVHTMYLLLTLLIDVKWPEDARKEAFLLHRKAACRIQNWLKVSVYMSPVVRTSETFTSSWNFPISSLSQGLWIQEENQMSCKWSLPRDLNLLVAASSMAWRECFGSISSLAAANEGFFCWESGRLFWSWIYITDDRITMTYKTTHNTIARMLFFYWRTDACFV